MRGHECQTRVRTKPVRVSRRVRGHEFYPNENPGSFGVSRRVRGHEFSVGFQYVATSVSRRVRGYEMRLLLLGLANICEPPGVRLCNEEKVRYLLKRP